MANLLKPMSLKQQANFNRFGGTGVMKMTFEQAQAELQGLDVKAIGQDEKGFFYVRISSPGINFERRSRVFKSKNLDVVVRKVRKIYPKYTDK